MVAEVKVPNMIKISMTGMVQSKLSLAVRRLQYVVLMRPEERSQLPESIELTFEDIIVASIIRSRTVIQSSQFRLTSF